MNKRIRNKKVKQEKETQMTKEANVDILQMIDKKIDRLQDTVEKNNDDQNKIDKRVSKVELKVNIIITALSTLLTIVTGLSIRLLYDLINILKTIKTLKP